MIFDLRRSVQPTAYSLPPTAKKSRPQNGDSFYHILKVNLIRRPYLSALLYPAPHSVAHTFLEVIDIEEGFFFVGKIF